MKYIFFDVDNTLWDDRFRIPESAVYAIRELRAHGHKVFLNSGRSKANLQDPSLQALRFDGFIAACGCHIEEAGETLYEYVVRYARETGCYNVTLNVWTCNPGAMAFYEKLGMKPYRVGMEAIL